MMPAMKVRVTVMPKTSVLDPQGVATANAIRHLGLEAISSARIGKVIEMEFQQDVPEDKLHEVARDLLSNPVIEDYRIERE